MPDCIRINGLEHLPLEETLLIHYTVVCSGLWDLSQNLTAYRNVCDDEWTVMYPNFQHPRHTDFPLLVPPGGLQGTFAWNYGGILGIDPVDFDDNHSYLTQLTIYEYDCYYTGVTGQPSTTGQTGSMPTGVDPSGLNPVPSLPRPPHSPPLPPPHTPVPGRPPVRFPPNPDPTSPNPLPVPGPRPISIRNPVPGDPDPVPSGEPEPPIVREEPRSGEGNDPTRQWTPISNVGVYNLRGETQTPNTSAGSNPILATHLGVNLRGQEIYTEPTTAPVTSVINVSLNTNQNTYNTVTRPGQTSLASERYYESELRSSFIPTVPSTSIRTPQEGGSNSFDIGAVEGNTAGLPGHLGNIRSLQRPGGVQNLVSLRQIDTSHILVGSFVALQVNNDEIAAGMPLVVTASYFPPEGNQASVQGTVYLLASSEDVYELVSGTNSTCSSTNMFQLGITASTYGISPGRATIVLVVRETNSGYVIGTASKTMFFRGPKLIGQTSRIDSTPYQTTSQGMLKGTREVSSSVFKSYKDISVSHNGTKTFIVDRVEGTTGNLSCIYIGSNKRPDFNIDIYTTTLYTYNYRAEIGIESDTTSTIPLVSGATVIETEARITINNNEVSTNFPIVGMTDIPVGDTINLQLGPLPSANNSYSVGRLYLSEGFSFREWEATATSSGAYLYSPYADEDIRLIINGFISGRIPSTYTAQDGHTNYSGVAFYSGIRPTTEQYYSAMVKGDGTYNPYKFTEATFQA